MLAESTLRSALDKVTPIKLAGKFWRVVATSSLLGLVRGENGLPEVTRVHPNLLFAGGPRRVGGRYTPMEGPDTLYLASSERAANAEWKAGLQALFPGVEYPPKTVFATKVNLTRVLDLSTDEIQRALRTNSAELAQPWKARNGPVTQRLGLACFESGRFSALRYRSTKAAPSYCLAVFPSHMDSAEYVSVLDPQEFFSQIQLTSSKEI
jgi:RES domain-containing protein